MEEITRQNLTKEDSLSEKEVIAQNITFFRKKLDMSQTELGKALNYSNKNISKWEKGETTPDIFTLKKLAKIFNVTLDTLTNPILDENKEAIKTKKAVPHKWKVYMLLLTDTIIFLLSCVSFFLLAYLETKIFTQWHVFIIAVILINISVFIFLCCTQKRVEVISLSVLCWLIIISIFIVFKSVPKIGYIFIIGVALQLFVIALAKLINSGKIIKINKLILKRAKK